MIKISYLCSTPVAGCEVRTMLNMLSPILPSTEQLLPELLYLMSTSISAQIGFMASDRVTSSKTVLRQLWNTSKISPVARWQHQKYQRVCIMLFVQFRPWPIYFSRCCCWGSFSVTFWRPAADIVEACKARSAAQTQFAAPRSCSSLGTCFWRQWRYIQEKYVQE